MSLCHLPVQLGVSGDGGGGARGQGSLRQVFVKSVVITSLRQLVLIDVKA